MGKYNSITINSVLAVLITLLQLITVYRHFWFSLYIQSWVYCPADDIQLGAHALAEVLGSTCSGGKHSTDSNLKRLRTSFSKPVTKSSFQLDRYTVSWVHLFSTCHKPYWNSVLQSWSPRFISGLAGSVLLHSIQKLTRLLRSRRYWANWSYSYGKIVCIG